MALNLKVTDRAGGDIDVVTAAVESFGKAFLLPVDCLVGWLAMPGRKLRLFNRLSNTIVVQTRETDAPEGVEYVRVGVLGAGRLGHQFGGRAAERLDGHLAARHRDDGLGVVADEGVAGVAVGALVVGGERTFGIARRRLLRALQQEAVVAAVVEGGVRREGRRLGVERDGEVGNDGLVVIEQVDEGRTVVFRRHPDTSTAAFRTNDATAS